MVDVTHDYDYRSALDEVLIRILAVVDDALFYGDDYLTLYLRVELHRDEGGCVEIDNVVRGDHGAHEERLLHDLGYGSLEL